MIWKKPPHIANEGDKIHVVFKSHEGWKGEKTICTITVSPNQQWDIIEKWCFLDELTEFKTKKIKEKAGLKRVYG